MKREHFKVFMDRLEQADSHDWIWWQGYLWLDLTEKQAEKVRSLLKVHPCIERVADGLQTPSGMIVKEIDND